MTILTFSNVLVLHIIAGSVALLSGLTALIPKKGSRVHVAAGKAFGGSMSVMGVTGIALALICPTRSFSWWERLRFIWSRRVGRPAAGPAAR